MNSHTMYTSRTSMIEKLALIMAHRPSLWLLSMGFNVYNYIYMFVSLTQGCVVYVVKEVTSFPGAQSINGRGT